MKMLWAMLLPFATLVLSSTAATTADDNVSRIPVSPPMTTDCLGRFVGSSEHPIVYQRNSADYSDCTERAAVPDTGSDNDDVPIPHAGSVITVNMEWERMVFGTSMGRSGMEVTDLEGDGTAEIVLAASTATFGSNTFWYILQKAGSQYQVIHVDSSSGATITAIRVANIDGDSDLDIVVARTGQIQVFDGTTRALIRTISNNSTVTNGLRTVDVDSDGQLEFVLCDEIRLYIYDVATGAIEGFYVNRGGFDLDVGNVDSDPDLEIVIGRGTNPGYVLNGITRAVETTYNPGFGWFTRLHDLDGDGKMELVSGQNWNRINTYDLDPVFSKYLINTDQDVNAMKVYDVDGNGAHEIVYGDGQWGDVHVHNGQTGAFMWSIPQPDHGVANIAFGDCDNDGAAELVWSSGFSATSTDHLYIVGAAGTHPLEWKSTDMLGPFYAMDYGDVDDDGLNELLFASVTSENNSYPGPFFVQEAGTYQQEYYWPPNPSTVSNLWAWRLRHANVDNDPQHEIILISGTGQSGKLICLDGNTRATQWQYPLAGTWGFYSLDIADLDGDGTLEVVAGATSVNGPPIHQLDATSGSFEWQSPGLGSSPSVSLRYLRLANVDSDAALEMVMVGTDGALSIIDGEAHDIDLQTGNLNITSLDTADLDGNGIDEIVVGTNTGIHTVDPDTGALSPIANATFASSLCISDIIPGPPLEMACMSANKLSVRTLSGAALWTSPTLGGSAGLSDSLMVADIDQDGRVEMVANRGENGIRVYEVRVHAAGDMNCDGFVDLSDVSAFVLAATDPLAHAATFPSCPLTRGDFTGDGLTDGTDIRRFVTCISTPGPCAQ